MAQDWVEIDLQNLGETDMAVNFDDGDRAFWIPKSQMSEYPEKGQTGRVVLKHWIANKEGLI